MLFCARRTLGCLILTLPGYILGLHNDLGLPTFEPRDHELWSDPCTFDLMS